AIRGENMRVNDFPDDVLKLQRYLSSENSSAKVRAIPGEGLDIPIWILGSSLDSARLAAAMGLRYAFASHFSPHYFLQAIDLYRRLFKPSAQLDSPYVMTCVNVVAADSDAEANYLITSLLQLFMGVVTGKTKPLQRPVNDMRSIWDEEMEAAVLSRLSYSFVGSADKIKATLQSFVDRTAVDEIMITSHIFDLQARLRSQEIFAESMKGIVKSKR
ncbi:MAG TPA: MsnO8 family LLM class oxidoreductase, partial [Chryseolinea sp.]|nr:MsnO8 family LLM class oxidoreductase [Chryseolinea sp.]